MGKLDETFKFYIFISYKATMYTTQSVEFTVSADRISRMTSSDKTAPLFELEI